MKARDRKRKLYAKYQIYLARTWSRWAHNVDRKISMVWYCDAALSEAQDVRAMSGPNSKPIIVQLAPQPTRRGKKRRRAKVTMVARDHSYGRWPGLTWLHASCLVGPAEPAKMSTDLSAFESPETQ